jgi:hypothetical protein
MKIDLHIYRPKDLKRDGLAKIIQQAWERGPKNSAWSTDTAEAAAARPASTTRGPDVSGSSCGRGFAATSGAASGSSTRRSTAGAGEPRRQAEEKSRAVPIRAGRDRAGLVGAHGQAVRQETAALEKFVLCSIDRPVLNGIDSDRR